MAEGQEFREIMEELLGPPTEVTDGILRDYEQRGDFSELGFNLYKETGIVMSVCAHTNKSEEPDKAVLTRNQAICAGLLIRIAKFMTAVAQLAATARRGEVVMALNRSIMESAINLRFLLTKNEDRFFDQFARFSLGPERELYDLIQANIQARGGEVLVIEKRMLKSIQRVCRLTGVDINNVERRYGDWGGGMRERMKALGEENLYGSQRTGSHAVHGTWVDLVLHHLEFKNGGYVPDPSWLEVDCRLMLPVCIIVSEAAFDYVKHFFGPNGDAELLLNRIDDLHHRIEIVDRADEAHRARH